MITTSLENKTILITGVCGTVGHKLLEHIAKLNPRDILGMDNNETDLFYLSNQYQAHSNIHFCLGDVRDLDNLMRKMRGINIVFHLAALKHVNLCEGSPSEAIQTNVIGTQNVIDAALANSVERIIYTSSDKAVNPTNVMGTSKLMAEKLMTAANALHRDEGAIFSSVRFGNILGSRGSVIPIFKRQIETGSPITLTDPRMTRFMMTLDDAIKLVLDASFMAKGGEVFVTKMPVVKIEDLAHVVIDALSYQHFQMPSDIDIQIIGPKPGEKMYEELVSSEEVNRTLELDRYYVIQPAIRSLYKDVDYLYPGMKKSKVDTAYNSSLFTPMPVDELKNYLIADGQIPHKSERTKEKEYARISVGE